MHPCLDGESGVAEGKFAGGGTGAAAKRSEDPQFSRREGGALSSSNRPNHAPHSAPGTRSKNKTEIEQCV